MLEDEVEVAVVVQDTAAGRMCAAGGQQIDGGQAMMSDPCKVMLRIESGTFDSLVDRKARQPLEALHYRAVIPSGLSRESSLEKEWQAGCQPFLFDPVEDDFLAVLRNLVAQ